MYAISPVSVFDIQGGNFKTLKDKTWTGLPAPIADYTNPDKTVFNIAYNY